VILLMIVFNELLANYIVDVIGITVITPIIVFAFVYLMLNSKREAKLNRRFVINASAVVFLYNVIGLVYFETSAWPIIYQILIIVLFAFLLGPKSFRTLVKEPRRAYRIAFFCWLLVSSLVPVVYYYKVAYAHESDIWTRHELLDFKESLDRKNAHNTEKDEEGNYFLFIDNTSIIDLDTTTQKIFQQLLYQALPSFSELTIKNKGLAYPSSNESPIKWGANRLQKEKRIALEYSDNQLEERYLSANINKISFSTLFDSPGLYVFMTLIFLFFLYMLYRIIFFAISKIYSWDVRFERLTGQFDKGWIAPMLDSRMNLMLLGLPNSGKTAALLSEFDSKEVPLRGDCILIHHDDIWQEFVVNALKPKNKIIILDNFEYQTESHETNRKKLYLLERLVSTGKKIIISTEVHLSAIPEFYTKAVESTADKKTKEEYGQNIQIWRNVTSSFVDLHKPLSENFKSKNLGTLNSELRYGSYLSNTSGVRPVLLLLAMEFSIQRGKICGLRFGKRHFLECKK